MFVGCTTSVDITQIQTNTKPSIRDLIKIGTIGCKINGNEIEYAGNCRIKAKPGLNINSPLLTCQYHNLPSPATLTIQQNGENLSKITFKKFAAGNWKGN